MFKRGAGRDDPYDIAMDQAHGFPGILKLVAHRNTVAPLHQTSQVGVHGVVRHAAHGDPLALANFSGCQRDLQFPGGDKGIVIKQFVKIPQPEHQEHTRIATLQLMVLLHHGGEIAEHR